MKYFTPKNLVLVAILLPAVVMAAVFLPRNGASVSYDSARDNAGKEYSTALFDANLITKNRDAEGRAYFDAGAKAFDSGEDFKISYGQRYSQCIKAAAYAYCDAAGQAFSDGYFYSDRYHKRNQAYILKQTQRDNWQTDVKNGKLPSYLIRQ